MLDARLKHRAHRRGTQQEVARMGEGRRQLPYSRTKKNPKTTQNDKRENARITAGIQVKLLGRRG
jgi:hypothetical protein